MDYRCVCSSNTAVADTTSNTATLTLTRVISITSQPTPQGATAPAAATTVANLPIAADSIEIYVDNWYDIQPVHESNQYLADDVPMTEEAVFTLPIHQRSDNFDLRVYSNSPFPVALASMMWEGQYSPRYYKRI